MKITKSLVAAAVALIAVPAIAQTAPSDTIAKVLEKGVTMNVVQMGMTGDVAYKPDGTFYAHSGISVILRSCRTLSPHRNPCC